MHLLSAPYDLLTFQFLSFRQCRRAKTHGIDKDPLNVRVVVSRIGLMSRLEIKYLSVSARKCAAAPENLAALKPSC